MVTDNGAKFQRYVVQTSAPPGPMNGKGQDKTVYKQNESAK